MLVMKSSESGALNQDYFTNKVYSVGKSGSPCDVTQGKSFMAL